MYTSSNIESHMQSYGTPDSLSYTISTSTTAGKGRNKQEAENHFQTTNQLFYNQLPVVRLCTSLRDGRFLNMLSIKITKLNLDPTGCKDITSRNVC
jgi:hypothetical protein